MSRRVLFTPNPISPGWSRQHRWRGWSGWLVLLAVAAAAGCAVARKPTMVLPQDVEMDARTLAKFQEEVEEYVELRRKVLTKIPPFTDQATAEELAAHQQALTSTIIAYRKDRRQGEIFKPDVEAAIRRILQKEFSGPQGPDLIKAIKQGNPKVEGNPAPNNPTREVKEPVTLAVNAVYNPAAPFSSVPPSLLRKLPLLPDEVRYRFVGRAIILRDTEANVILDYIKDVVPDSSIPR